MHQCRPLIDLLHTAVVLDGGRGLESMAEGLRCRDTALGAPIACEQSSFLRKLCKMLMGTFEALCTDEDVSLVLCTPAVSDGDHAYRQS